MKDFKGKTAVITGAGSGFGREFARQAARLGMNLVLADIEAEALETTAAELCGTGAQVITAVVDVSQGEQMESLATRTRDVFGATHLLFNNAGVAAGGYIWEHSQADWQWVLGVNLWGVIHGLRCFVPAMIEHGEPCHVINTASVAGLISPQLLGAYNVSKHGVVALSETLYQDLRIAGAEVGVSVLCPAFVATGIAQSHRNRPSSLGHEGAVTQSMQTAQKAVQKAVAAGKLSAADIAEQCFDAIRANRFYVITHPNILPSVELRMQDILTGRQPSDPFSFKQDVATRLS